MFLQRNKTKCQGGTNLLELSDPFHSQIDVRRTDSPYLTTLIVMRNSVIKQCGHKYNLHHLVTVVPEVLVAIIKQGPHVTMTSDFLIALPLTWLVGS